MLDELSGDHAQSLQLAMAAHQLLTEDDGVKTTATEVDRSLIMSMVVADTNLGAQVAKQSSSYTGYETLLLELNIIVQNEIMIAVSSTYGYFILPKKLLCLMRQF